MSNSLFPSLPIPPSSYIHLRIGESSKPMDHTPGEAPFKIRVVIRVFTNLLVNTLLSVFCIYPIKV